MFDESVFARLREMSDKILVSHNIHIMGMGESAIEEVLFDLMKNSTNPTLAPYAKESEVRLRVSALARSEEEGEKMCARMIEKVKNSPVGKHIYALDAERIEKLVVAKLKEKGLTLAVAESCTGGYIGKLLTDIPGASAAFAGGFITYSNEAKINLLGVSPETLQKHSAVSPETAMEMARGARERLGTDLAVSVTGEAGPNPDPQTGKPVGTVFLGISSAQKTYSVQVKIPPQRNRDYIRNVATNRALREILIFLNEI
jgi:nicotinamide-nucleotide amidase